MLLCDKSACKRGAHVSLRIDNSNYFLITKIYCLPVPLAKVPTGKWYCDLHQKKPTRKSAEDGEGDEEYADAFRSDEESGQSDEDDADIPHDGEASEVRKKEYLYFIYWKQF